MLFFQKLVLFAYLAATASAAAMPAPDANAEALAMALADALAMPEPKAKDTGNSCPVYKGQQTHPFCCKTAIGAGSAFLGVGVQCLEGAAKIVSCPKTDTKVCCINDALCINKILGCAPALCNLYPTK